MMAPSSSSQQSSWKTGREQDAYLEEDLGLDQLGSQAEQHEHKEAAHGSRVLRHPLACNSTSHSLVLCWCAAKMQCKRDLCLAVCGAPCSCVGIYRLDPAAAWLRQIAVARIRSGASNESNGMSLMAKGQLPSWRIQNGIKRRLIVWASRAACITKKRERVCSAGTRRTSMGDPLRDAFFAFVGFA